jgi:hypothetical protein
MSAMQTSRCSSLSHATMQFDASDDIPRSLQQISQIWESVKAERTDMPLVEDFDLVLLRDHADRVFMVDVADQPFTLRIESAGWRVADAYGEPLAGHHVENAEARAPLDELWVQCMAAIHDRRPVFYRHDTPTASYERIVLPLWGDSHVEKLIVVYEETPSRVAVRRPCTY